MNQQITVEDAYREACLALGEAIVQQRLLGAEIHRLQGLVENGPQHAGEPDNHQKHPDPANP